jgi:glycosyltransferase involved in cell wall biosynthesis
MKIGYLQVGAQWHGVYRYGKLLAQEAQKRENLDVIEVNLSLKQDWKQNRAILLDAAKQLSAADIVQIQYSVGNNKDLWGQGWLKFYYLWVFLSQCSSALSVTFHDVYNLPFISKQILELAERWYHPPSGSTTPINTVVTSVASKTKRRKLGDPVYRAIALLQRIYRTNFEAFTIRWLIGKADLVFVCSQEEAQRLNTFASNSKTEIVPIYVEERSIAIDKQKARQILGIDEKQKIITLLGYIHPRKGHHLIVEAMSKLPADIVAIFAGSASPNAFAQAYLEQLWTQAKTYGVARRLRITGYLSEEELELYLLATDLAVCPFSNLSASASLSTWISIARPILAFDLPQMAEYNKIETDAIKTFSPYTSEALSNAIASFFNATYSEIDPGVDRLRKKLSVTKIFDQFLTYYHSAAKTTSEIEFTTH